MSQNQEIIEAKLCAYIDGELDPEGRAEIEKHLEANPQHRRLLESLKATRDLVRWLPRESAPPELAETLNGQLERSVLLDYDGESLRPRIFPRVFAAAAIIVLTAGLAAAVYFALPKSHRNATQIATNAEQPKPAEVTGTPAEPTVAHPESERDKDSVERLSKGGGPSDAIADAKQSADAAKLSVAPELDHMARDVAANSSTIVAAANGYAPQETPPASINNAVVMLVRTDKPEAAQKELTDYLTSNQIEWRPAEPTQALGEIVHQERAANTNQASAAVQQETLKQREETSPNPLTAAKARATTLNENAVASPALRSATTQPAGEGAPQQQSQTDSQGIAAAQQPNSAAYFGNSTANPRANGLYVARMSRTQARALSLTMNQGAQQAAEVKEVGQSQNAAPQDRGIFRAGGDQGGLGAPTTQSAGEQQQAANSAIAPARQEERAESGRRSRSFMHGTTGPTSDVIAAGEELRLVSARQDLQAKKPAADEPPQTVRVSADGTVNLPIIGVVHCAGLTVEQANQAIAQAAAAKQEPADALKIERLGRTDAQPQTFDARLSDDERMRVAGRPATQPATTQPLASSQAGDEPVNVVIVVEPNSEVAGAAGAAAPATQPAPAEAAPPLAQPAPQTAPAH